MIAGCAVGSVLKPQDFPKLKSKSSKDSTICLDSSALCPCLTSHLIWHYLDGNLADAITLWRGDSPVKYSINVDCKSPDEGITGWTNESLWQRWLRSFSNRIMWPHSGVTSTCCSVIQRVRPGPVSLVCEWLANEHVANGELVTALRVVRDD